MAAVRANGDGKGINSSSSCSDARGRMPRPRRRWSSFAASARRIIAMAPTLLRWRWRHIWQWGCCRCCWWRAAEAMLLAAGGWRQGCGRWLHLGWVTVNVYRLLCKYSRAHWHWQRNTHPSRHTPAHQRPQKKKTKNKKIPRDLSDSKHRHSIHRYLQLQIQYRWGTTYTNTGRYNYLYRHRLIYSYIQSERLMQIQILTATDWNRYNCSHTNNVRRNRY